MYLAKNKLASKICVADKVLWQIAGLSKAEQQVYDSPLVSFKQADLGNPEHANGLYSHDGGKWDFVINLAAATKYSQGKEVYDANIVNATKNSSTAAAKNSVKRFIHVSTGQVYDANKKPSGENDKVKPWTAIAKAHEEAENVVRATSGLNFVIVRPAIVYGTGDIYGLTPRLIVGSIYKYLGKKMETLYSSGLRVNTVHADDVAKALHFLCTKGTTGAVYNLSDGNDTDQGKINKLLEGIYGIKTDFVGAIKMTAASAMGTKFLVGFANDSHLKPFSDACKKYGIYDTPLTPYLDEELVLPNPLSIDGHAIEAVGFKYDHPAPSVENLKVVLRDYIEKGYFPKEMLDG
jgi:nucleoside-diphosphate-sugar epimerase